MGAGQTAGAGSRAWINGPDSRLASPDAGRETRPRRYPVTSGSPASRQDRMPPASCTAS